MANSRNLETNPTIISIGKIRELYPFKGINQKLKQTMPVPPEFKTKLKFDPSKLSTAILKQYLLDILRATEPDQLLAGDPPAPYTKDPDNLTNYKVLKELGLMSVKEWKMRLEKSNNDVEQLYLEDDMVSQDSRYYYESWKTIQEEVGNHEKQMSFFRLVSEIVRNLGNRNFVEITDEGESRTLSHVAQDANVEKGKMAIVKDGIFTHSIPNLKIIDSVPVSPVSLPSQPLSILKIAEPVSPPSPTSLPSLKLEKDEIQMAEVEKEPEDGANEWLTSMMD